MVGLLATFIPLGGETHKTDVAGASDAPAAGCSLAAIEVFHTSAAALTNARRDGSKFFVFFDLNI